MFARWIGNIAIGSFAVTASVALAQPAPPAPAAVTDPSVTVVGEKPAKAEASDKVTDPKDPNFVRCRSEPVLNSRAQRVKVCRTNKEWAAASREGNRQTQELLNAGRPTQPSP